MSDETRYDVHATVTVHEHGWENRYERSGDVWFRVTDLERWIVGGETHFVLHHVEKLNEALTLANQRAAAAEAATKRAEHGIEVALNENEACKVLLIRIEELKAERDALRKDAAAEAAAKAMFEGDDQMLGKWTNAKPETREHYVRLARRGLDAALAVEP